MLHTYAINDTAVPGNTSSIDNIGTQPPRTAIETPPAYADKPTLNDKNENVPTTEGAPPKVFKKFDTLNTIPTASSPQENYGIAAGSGWIFISSQELENRMDILNDLGVTWLRFDMLWDIVQPKNASGFDWSKIDKVVTAANNHGIQLLPILDNTPKWAAIGNCNHPGWCEPADVQSFANYAAAATKRYAPQGIHNWEIWNEQNKVIFWYPKPNPIAYSNLLKATYPAIKNVDRSATVITGGFGGIDPSGSDISNADYLTGMYDNGAAPYFDAVGMHPYTYPLIPSVVSDGRTAWLQMTSGTDSIRNVMVLRGDASKQIWITEFGAPTRGPGASADVNAYNLKSSPRYVTEALQSTMIKDAIQQYKAQDYFGPLFWYTLKDNSNDPSTTENFFGLIRSDNSHKPAYEEFKALIPHEKEVAINNNPKNTTSMAMPKMAESVKSPLISTSIISIDRNESAKDEGLVHSLIHLRHHRLQIMLTSLLIILVLCYIFRSIFVRQYRNMQQRFKSTPR